MDKEHAKSRLQINVMHAVQAWYLDIFGEELNQKNNWGFSNAREAIAFHLVKKFGWTIDYCHNLKDDDLHVLLREDMRGWKIPNEIAKIAEELDSFLKRDS